MTVINTKTIYLHVIHFVKFMNTFFFDEHIIMSWTFEGFSFLYKKEMYMYSICNFIRNSVCPSVYLHVCQSHMMMRTWYVVVNTPCYICTVARLYTVTMISGTDYHTIATELRLWFALAYFFLYHVFVVFYWFKAFDHVLVFSDFTFTMILV